MRWTYTLLDRGLLPDPLIRSGIRRRLSRKVVEEAENHADFDRTRARHLNAMKASPIAVTPETANEQHYEVPAAFFEQVLGPLRKYSCCYYERGDEPLAEAEARALAITCEHADLSDGQRILELGCGWGPLTLWMAEHYPASTITAVSNSRSQREYIVGECRRRGLNNVSVITADMNAFTTPGAFDRVVSVEMFEHMRNWRELLKRIHGWLVPGGKLFVHFFCHRQYAYFYETASEDDWMGRHFFTGGTMPSADLLDDFQDNLRLVQRWTWPGDHYAQTCNDWLERFDKKRDPIRDSLVPVYGEEPVDAWMNRWRVFFMACAELFAFHDGNEWFVAHNLMVKP